MIAEEDGEIEMDLPGIEFTTFTCTHVVTCMVQHCTVIQSQ